ncbi:MAG: BACON domain-containing protein [Bacteroidales bacterium]|nr:BACON domain-containing protein [Bacteroidales bacterium]
MKKLFGILMVALSVFSLASCNGENEIDEKGASTIVINSKDIQLPAKGGESSFLVDSDVDFIVSVSHDWVSVSKDGNLVKVAAEKNSSLQGRYAELSVSNGKDGASIVINQLGYISSDVEFDDISVSYLGQFVELEYEYNDFISASTDAEWIILDNATGAEGARILRVHVGENKTERPRSATIEWTLGLESGSFVVKQRREMKEYSVNNSWNISYLGADNDIYKVGVAGVSGEYAVTAVPASKLAQGGFSNVAEYLTESDSDIASAIADGEIAVYSGDKTVELSNLSGGENYAVVLGYNSSKSELTGEYNVVTFKVEGADLRTPYEKWLGTWAVQRGSETDTWTITENVKNSSYKIDGIDDIASGLTSGASFPIDAQFDSATGDMIIHVQTGLTTVNINDEPTSLDLYGVIIYNGNETIVTGNYDIVRLKMGKGTATMEGNVLHLSGADGEFPVIGMRHVLMAEEGYYNFNPEYTLFDQTITQLTKVDGTGTGDDPGTDPGSNKGYAGWLGNWTYSDGTNNFNVSITQKAANSTYNVSGFAQEYVYEAVYDSATGAIEINGTQLLDTGIELSNGEVVNLYLLAVDSEDYIEYGNPDKNYRLVIGKLSSDGKSATFEGDVYDAVYGGQTYHEKIISFGVVGMTEDDKLYTLSSYPHANLPGSLSKASSGVSRKVGSGVYTKNPSKVHAASVRGYEKPFSFSGKYAVGTQYYRRAK